MASSTSSIPANARKIEETREEENRKKTKTNPVQGGHTLICTSTIVVAVRAICVCVFVCVSLFLFCVDKKKERPDQVVASGDDNKQIPVRIFF